MSCRFSITRRIRNLMTFKFAPALLRKFEAFIVESKIKVDVNLIKQLRGGRKVKSIPFIDLPGLYSLR